ncbi:MAG: 3'-5' exonuclease, partial [Flavobacteriaceae bacterium]|nr:3'-5' exonuclease [Flavobacteriaceae bacterium]
IPSPKDDIDGSEVYSVYYEENNLDRIVAYCERDTITVAQILLRLRGDDLLTNEEIKHI